MKKYAYVGSRTTRERNARGNGIEVYEVNESSGSWTHIQTMGDIDNPSYLCMDKTGAFMYAVHGDKKEASAFAVDRGTGMLSYLNTVPIPGQNPVYLLPDKTNRYILIACLGTGNIIAVKREDDGRLGITEYNHYLPGAEEGRFSCPHQIAYDREEEFMFVSAKGGRESTAGAKYGMNLFTFTPEEGFKAGQQIGGRNLDECRHVVVHPDNRFVYQVNERRNVVISYCFDSETGSLCPFQTSQTLPDCCADTKLILASGICITEDGKYLYVSNRGHDSVAMFRVEQESGKLVSTGFMPSMGDFPRFIGISPSSRYLYVANERSDSIMQYEIARDGKLVYTNYMIQTGSPVCIIFSR